MRSCGFSFACHDIMLYGGCLICCLAMTLCSMALMTCAFYFEQYIYHFSACSRRDELLMVSPCFAFSASTRVFCERPCCPIFHIIAVLRISLHIVGFHFFVLICRACIVSLFEQVLGAWQWCLVCCKPSHEHISSCTLQGATPSSDAVYP
jgi:hypothetical protein